MPPISTRNLDLLPDASALREVLRSMAMLDAILCPEWQFRYYSFNARWADGEEMASMRDGSGDDFFALFNSYGCFLKGFAHEAPAASTPISPQEHYEGLPTEFAACVTEPAFRGDEVTFCIWRSFADVEWKCSALRLPEVDDPDGSADLLAPLDGSPETYRQWAEDYYEVDIPLEPVKAIYQRRPLTVDVVAALNPELGLKDLTEDICEIGYPDSNE